MSANQTSLIERPIPGTIEEIDAEVAELKREHSLHKLALSKNLPHDLAAPKRYRRVVIEERIAALNAARKRIKSTRHEHLMDAFYTAAHDVLDQDQIADIWDRLYLDHPELESKRCTHD